MTEDINSNIKVAPFYLADIVDVLDVDLRKDAGFKPELTDIVDKNLQKSNPGLASRHLKISKVLKNG